MRSRVDFLLNAMGLEAYIRCMLSEEGTRDREFGSLLVCASSCFDYSEDRRLSIS